MCFFILRVNRTPHFILPIPKDQTTAKMMPFYLKGISPVVLD